MLVVVIERVNGAGEGGGSGDEGAAAGFGGREGRVVFPAKQQARLLEYRAVGEDHDGGFFGVWAGDFGDFAAALRVLLVCVLIEDWAEGLSYLPSARFKHLGERKLVVTLQSKKEVDLRQELVQEANRERTPFNDDIVVGSEQGHDFHAGLPLARSVHLVLFKPPLCVFRLQREQASIHQQSTVAVLWQTSHELNADEVYVGQLLHGYHERVSQPLSQLMERYNVLPRLSGV